MFTLKGTMFEVTKVGDSFMVRRINNKAIVGCFSRGDKGLNKRIDNNSKLSKLELGEINDLFNYIQTETLNETVHHLPRKSTRS